MAAGTAEASAPAAPRAALDSFSAALAADEAEDRRAHRRRQLALVLGLPIAGGLLWLGWSFLSGKPDHQPQQRQVINTVTRLTLPPPPPPPPPPRTDPPPEPVVQPRVQEPQKPLERVEPKPEAPAPKAPQPPGPPATLGLPTGPGGANPYGIGGGGGDGSVIGGPGGGGGGGSRFAGYAGAVQSSLQRALQRDERTRRGAWRVTVRIWVGPGGQVTRLQVVGTTGSAERDNAIQQVLTGVTVQAPPSDLPQPIIARIDSRA